MGIFPQILVENLIIMSSLNNLRFVFVLFLICLNIIPEVNWVII